MGRLIIGVVNVWILNVLVTNPFECAVDALRFTKMIYSTSLLETSYMALAAQKDKANEEETNRRIQLIKELKMASVRE